jgi:predicted amino acid-binding ACT domain protein
MASIAARSSVWSQVKQIPVKYPMGFGIVLSGFKTSFSDLLVQKVVERREEIDWKRNAAFATFGFIYLGGVQYTLYVPIFGRLFPNAASFAAKPLAQKMKDVKGMMNVTAQVFLDQCVHHPLMYFPAFYCTKEIVMSEKPDIPKVLRQYQKNMSEDLAALWTIWVPLTFINFAFMPMHFRIPFAAGVSLLWTCVLSTMRGGDVAHGEDMAGGAITGSTYSLLKEGLDEKFNMTPVEMDSNLAHFNISVIGKQRPGLVAMFCRHISDMGGNVTHSKMSRLGQEFIMQMHVSVPPEKAQKVLKSLKAKQFTKELDIQATKLTRRDYETGHNKKSVMGMRMYCVGADK